ncbi:hypothetical protein ACVWZZ_004488 [Bradyrhizobium sp. LM6.10]
MRDMGLQGVIRGKPVKTTISDKAAPCPLDRVNRQFRRLLEPTGNIPPAEAEQRYYAMLEQPAMAA